MADRRMTRTTKGLIAAALGLGLLGGYGTFALWSDSQQVQGGAITAGNLSLTTEGASTWTDISPSGPLGWTGTSVFGIPTGSPVTIGDIDTFRMVPGDLLQYETTVRVVATGDNMQAQLSVDPASVDIPDELADNVVVQASLAGPDATPLGTSLLGSPITWTIDEPTPAGGALYSVTIRVGFDGNTTQLAGVNEALDISDLAVDLNQIRS